MNVQALKRKRVWVPVAVLLSFGTGVGAGGGGADSTPKTVTVEKRVEVPGPERVVTKEVPGPERVVTVTKTPASCITALDRADEGFTYAADGFGFAAVGFEAIRLNDVASVKRATAGLEGVGAKVGILMPKYRAANEACRAGK